MMKKLILAAALCFSAESGFAAQQPTKSPECAYEGSYYIGWTCWPLNRWDFTLTNRNSGQDFSAFGEGTSSGAPAGNPAGTGAPAAGTGGGTAGAGAAAAGMGMGGVGVD